MSRIKWSSSLLRTTKSTVDMAEDAAVAVDFETLAEKFCIWGLLIVKESMGILRPGVYLQVNTKFYEKY